MLVSAQHAQWWRGRHNRNSSTGWSANHCIWVDDPGALRLVPFFCCGESDIEKLREPQKLTELEGWWVHPSRKKKKLAIEPVSRFFIVIAGSRSILGQDQPEITSDNKILDIWQFAAVGQKQKEPMKLCSLSTLCSTTKRRWSDAVTLPPFKI